MRVITAALASKLRGPLSPVWYVMIEAASVDAWPGGKTAYVFATAAIPWTVPGTMVAELGRLDSDSIEDVVFEVDSGRLGGLAKTGDFRVKVSSLGGLVASLEAAGVYFEARRCSLYLCAAGTNNRADDLLIASGFITEVENADDTMNLRVEMPIDQYTKQVPPSVFDYEAQSYGNMIARDAEAIAIPLVFGVVDLAMGRVVEHLYKAAGVDYGPRIVYCDPSIGTIESLTDVKFGDSGLVEANGGFAFVNPDTGKSPWTLMGDKSGIYFTASRAERLYLELALFPTSFAADATAWPLRYADATYGEIFALDDPSIVSSALIPGGSIVTTTNRQMIFKLPPCGLDAVIDGPDTAPEVYALWRKQTGAGAISTDHVLFAVARHNGETGVGSGPLSWGLFLPGAYIAATNTPFDNWSEQYWNHRKDHKLEPVPYDGDYAGLFDDYGSTTKLAQAFIAITYQMVTPPTGTRAGTFIGGVGLLCCCNIAFPPSGYLASVGGYVDATGGPITGTAGTSITNPAHVLAFLWTYLSGAGLSRVAITEHRAVATGARAGLSFARQIRGDQKPVEDYVDELCAEALVWSWIDATGAARVFPLAAANPRDAFAIDYADVAEGVLKFARTPSQDVATKFVFKYHDNPVRDIKDKSLFCNGGTSSSEFTAADRALCASARDRYRGGVDKEVTVEFEWVRDRTTAVALARIYMAAVARRRWIIEFDADLALIGLEVGDPVRLEPGQWGADVPASVLAASYRVIGARVSPANDTVKVRAAECFQ